jgi:glycosyltransferase involved in cell wall biosynthesis
MVILQLVTSRQYRGAEVFAAGLSDSLAEAGHEVVYAGLYDPPENVLSTQIARNVDLNGKKSSFSFPLLFRLINLLKEINPAIVQANGSDTLKYAVLAKFFYPRIQIVYRNISMVSAWAKAGSVKRIFNRFLFKKVSRVTSVGQQSLADLVKTYGYPPGKTKLIRRGIPRYDFDPLVSRNKLSGSFGFDVTDQVLVHIGRFSPEKNHLFLIGCFEKVLASVSNAKLIFIGEGPLLGQIKETVQSKNLKRSIFFTGHIGQVQELLAGCDLFILGSTIEGVPGVVLEAAMQSVPTVAVNVGGMSEVVINGQTGILIEKHLPDEFGEAVVSLLHDEAKRKFLGNQAKSFVTSNFSIEKCLLQFEELYENMIREK